MKKKTKYTGKVCKRGPSKKVLRIRNLKISGGVQRGKETQSNSQINHLVEGPKNLDDKDDFLGESNIKHLNLGDFIDLCIEEEEKCNGLDYLSNEQEDEGGSCESGTTKDRCIKKYEDKEITTKLNNDLNKNNTNIRYPLFDFTDNTNSKRTIVTTVKSNDESSCTSEKKIIPPNQGYMTLDMETLKSYEHASFQNHGLKGLRDIVSAFSSACYIDDDIIYKVEENNGSGRKLYRIDSSLVYNILMLLCFRNLHKEFHYHLLGNGAGPLSVNNETESNKNIAEENQPIDPHAIEKSICWTKMKSIMIIFYKSTLQLITQVNKEFNLISFVLKSLSKYIPYLTPLPGISKTYLKDLTRLWSAPKDSSSDYLTVRLHSFLRIRQLAITQPFPFIEHCLKITYLAFARRSKFGNASAISSLIPTINFMRNCVVELYSLDFTSSYQHAFIYIRQLALHLRTALHKKSEDALQVVYCWQYIHCLKLWSDILSSACTSTVDGDEEGKLLRSLVYPLTEVIFGVLKLIPTTRYLPLRFHCIRMVQQLAASCVFFIPTSSILLEIFDLKEVKMKPKKKLKHQDKDVQGVQLPLMLKFQKEDTLRTIEQMDACLREVFVLLKREVELYRYSPGFPEYAFWILHRLRKFSTDIQNFKYRAYANECIKLCENYTNFAIKARSLLEIAPRNVKKLEMLKPEGIPVMHKRHDASLVHEKKILFSSMISVTPNTGSDINNKISIREKKTKKNVVMEKVDDCLSTSDLKASNDILDEVKEGIDWWNEEESDLCDEVFK